MLLKLKAFLHRSELESHPGDFRLRHRHMCQTNFIFTLDPQLMMSVSYHTTLKISFISLISRIMKKLRILRKKEMGITIEKIVALFDLNYKISH